MSFRTDLAAEARELHPDLPGIKEVTDKAGEGSILISRITVSNEESAKRIDKLCGQYITLEAPDLAVRDIDVFKYLSEQIKQELCMLMQKMTLDSEATILVVGLGNRYITPDSLGPRVIEGVYVTRHITEYMADGLEKKLRAVCALAPGVLGVTGIETFDIIEGVVSKLKPDLVIAVDSLASRRAARIYTTVQITDTGISPGSGVGNLRQGINSQCINTPVIAIGVPLVVYANTIVRDTITQIAERTGLHGDEERMKELADTVIGESMGQMIVTPKDIDTIITDMSRIIAEGVNKALHGDNYNDVMEIVT